MRLRRSLCLVLLCAVICCALFSVSAYAAGHNLPHLPKTNLDYWVIYFGSSGSYFAINCGSDFSSVSNGFKTTSPGDEYVLDNGEWRRYGACSSGGIYSVVPIYHSTGILSSNDNISFILSPIEYSDLKSIVSAFTGQISLTSIVNILVAGVSCSIGLVFLWWGARKAITMVIKAFKKGKLRI